ncbi:hypothetical protein BHM03_00025160 [Ensete ventricosum]|nr:hypothetical protein BHM03_00025160 [Ensete ventricosum]
MGFVSMRGRSLASSGSSYSSSAVLRLMQEQRSREAKKAATTLAPTHHAIPPTLSYVDSTPCCEFSSVAIRTLTRSPARPPRSPISDLATPAALRLASSPPSKRKRRKRG